MVNEPNLVRSRAILVHARDTDDALAILMDRPNPLEQAIIVLISSLPMLGVCGFQVWHDFINTHYAIYQRSAWLFTTLAWPFATPAWSFCSLMYSS